MSQERGIAKSEFRPSSDYYLPEEGRQRISAYVDGVIAKPGEMISTGDLDAIFESNLNTRATVANLPEGITEKDFAGQLMLACKTESATDSYIRPIFQSSDKFDQPWLREFGQLWYDDEISHALPFKKMLMELDYSEEEVDREMRESREAEFVYGEGYNPAQVTTFGTLQEYLTENYYDLLSGMTKQSSPEAAAAVRRIEKREILHRVWYTRMSAFQVEANPDNIVNVASAALNFSLPGNIVAPEFQKKASEWLPKMGADVREVQRYAAKYISQIAGNPEQTGRLVVELANQKGVKVGPITPAILKSALDIFGPSGYGLFGEAAMEKYVLTKPIPAESIPMKVRGLVRGKIAASLPDINMLSV